MDEIPRPAAGTWKICMNIGLRSSTAHRGWCNLIFIVTELAVHEILWSNYGPVIVSQCSETTFGSHPCRAVSVSYK